VFLRGPLANCPRVADAEEVPCASRVIGA
jgi:hypothetical protein